MFDDELWIKWEEKWYVTGIDLKGKKLRLIRFRWAPFYTSRQLPGQDKSDTTPLPSGLEKLVRACNITAAKTNGQFQIFAFNGYTNIEILESLHVKFCESLKVASEGDAAAQNLIPLGFKFGGSNAEPTTVDT